MTAPVRSKEKFLVFGAPLIEESEIDEVVSTLRSGWLGTGPRVARFERDFARYKGVEHAAAVNSCTAALHLSLLARGIGPGDEVITSALTFCSTVNAIIHSGATPVLADIDPRTGNVDPRDLETRITSRTRALLPVHLAGRPCAMAGILEVARKRNLVVIEDCAHAIETQFRGRHAGTIGDLGAFSFYVTKNVVTGEGGMALARREEDLQRLKVLALHGMSKDAWKRFSDEGYKHYYVVEAGWKYNMTDMQAALGIHQLARVEASWRRRQAVWNSYDEAFRGIPVTRPAAPEPDTRHGLHLYQIFVDPEIAGIGRDAFLDGMTAQGIGVGVHYLSIPEHPYYREKFRWRPEDYPHAMQLGRQTVSLPLSARLTDADAADVVEAVRRVLRI